MTARWCFYDTATGIFLRRTVLCSVATAYANAPAGHAPMPADGIDTLSQRADITAQPPPPVFDESGNDISPFWFPPVIDYQPPAPDADQWQTWAWDVVVKRWRAVATLAAVKRERIAELRAAAQADERADITLGAHTFAATPEARADYAFELQIALAAQADGQNYSGEIERANGNVITVTAAQIKALCRAIRDRSQTIRATLRAKVAQVMSANTRAEVAAVSWN